MCLTGVYRDLGRNGQALASARQAFALARECGLRPIEAHALTSLAVANLAREHFDDAAQDARQAIRLHVGVAQRIGEARAERVLGDALQATDGVAAALPHWQRAYDLFADIGMPQADQVDTLLRRHGKGQQGSGDFMMPGP